MMDDMDSRTSVKREKTHRKTPTNPPCTMIDDMDRRTSLKKKEQTCKHTDDVDNRTSVKKKEHNSYENTWTNPP